MIPVDAVKQSFDTWIKALGLAWWDIEIDYVDDPAEVLRRFVDEEGRGVVAAVCRCNWMYGDACIEVNLTAFADKKTWQIDRIVVHELMHILVNEMRQPGIEHEERVVTTLTKAFFWALDAVERRTDASSVDSADPS